MNTILTHKTNVYTLTIERLPNDKIVRKMKIGGCDWLDKFFDSADEAVQDAMQLIKEIGE